MIIFRNPGLIDLRAALTMGVNAKIDDSAIGFFGTGFKYAVAVLLRNHCKVALYRGLERHEFSATPYSHRGKEFSIVCMDSAELGFTTDLGKTWELWMAYRELYCNAMDEKGSVERYSADWAPNPDETSVVVSGAAFDSAHDLRAQFIFSETPDFTTESCQIVKKPSKALFYRGIKVHTFNNPTLLTYNITRQIDLTEDRTAKYTFQIEQTISHAATELLESGHDDLVKAILTASKDHFEHSVSWSEWYIDKSETVKNFVCQLANTHIADLVPAAVRLYSDVKSKLPITGGAMLELNENQALQLERAAQFAARLGFAVEEYPILCVERLGENVLGLARDGKIYISQQAFEMGTKIVAGTLIEEFIHLRHGHIDGSRGMQEFLLNRLVSLGEDHVLGKPL